MAFSLPLKSKGSCHGSVGFVKRLMEVPKLMRSELLVGFALLLCLGCGSQGPFDYVAVQGSLAYEDGTPIPAGGIQLKFLAQDVEAIGDAHPRPAIANLDNQGEFQFATSYKYGDGLVPGKHRVAILKAKDSKGKSLVPEEYASTSQSPLIIDTDDTPLVIKVPRP